MNACRVLAGCITLALLPADSAAQACRGRPGFSKSSVAVNAGAMTASDARSVSGGFTVGRPEGLSASGAIGHVVREASPTFNTDQTGTSLGASLGYAGTELGGRLEICPGLGISQLKVTGEFLSGDRATLTQTMHRAGLSTGYTLSVRPMLVLIPFASVEYVRFGGSVHSDNFHLPVPENTYYPIGLGLGVVLSDRFGLTGALTIPTGLPAGVGGNSFAISGSAALGNR